MNSPKQYSKSPDDGDQNKNKSGLEQLGSMQFESLQQIQNVDIK